MIWKQSRETNDGCLQAERFVDGRALVHELDGAAGVGGNVAEGHEPAGEGGGARGGGDPGRVGRRDQGLGVRDGDQPGEGDFFYVTSGAHKFPSVQQSTMSKHTKLKKFFWIRNINREQSIAFIKNSDMSLKLSINRSAFSTNEC